MKPNNRLLVLIVVLTLTLGVIFFGPAPGGTSGTGMISRPLVHLNRPAARSEPTAASTEVHIQTLRSRAEFGTSGDAFFVEEKTAAPAAAIAETKLNPPPLNPFSYIGKEKSNGEWQVFLARGEETFVVHADSNIDDSYHVSSINPPNMKLLYSPLQMEVDMNIGDSE